MSIADPVQIAPQMGLLERGELVGGAYRVQRQIGRGGMGAVFSALDERHGGAVAIKWVLPGREHARSRERLTREWHLARQVQHPNVVDILDSGEERGSSYLVMELLEGDSLEEWVVRGPYTPDFALRVMMPVMRGVGAAHAAGIVHRDLKPQNIILSRSEGGVRPTIIDFGISRAAEEGVEGDRKLTQHGITVGTPLYMAPEQLVGTQEADVVADVYALGVMLFELMAGAAPYEKPADSPELIHEKIDRNASRLSDLLPDVDPGLDAVVARALERSPSKRYGTVGELASALEPYTTARFDSEEPLYRGPSPLENPGQTLRVRPRGRRSNKLKLWLAGAGALFALLAVGLGVGALLAIFDDSDDETIEASELGSLSPTPATPTVDPPPSPELPPTPEPTEVATEPTPEAPAEVSPEAPVVDPAPATHAPVARGRRRRARPVRLPTRVSPRRGRRSRRGRSGSLSVDDF